MPKSMQDHISSYFLPNQDDLYCRDLPTTPQPGMGKILVTGGSGYVGGRLIPELQGRGYQVRVMVRKASSEHECLWWGSEIIEADALDPRNLEIALRDIHTAYYLIHSLYLGPSRFATTDVQAAANFRNAAERSGVQRIIYLGGLGDAQEVLSAHLKNRMRVASELTAGKVPVTVLRAAIIMGSGSASYEIIEHIARNLPIIPSPPWARNKCQPIGIRDVIKYLVGVLEAPETSGRSFDIGGQDVMSYQIMMEEFSRVLGKRKLFLPWPFASLTACSYLASLITPVPAQLIRCLFHSLNNHVVCQNNTIREIIPFRPLSYREMIEKAIQREDQDRVYTRWTDAYPPAHELAIQLSALTKAPKYTVAYSLPTNCSASSLHRAYCAVGGKQGWFHSNWMWRLRGMVDRILLGVGSSRGRRSMAALKVNDVIDFWRVEDIQINKRLLLRAEMKLPGRAWLEFSIKKGEDTLNTLFVKAFFDTEGWAGTAYWYAFLPFHKLIFVRLLEQIVARGSKIAEEA